MAIGKPLLVDVGRKAQEQVLSAQIAPLSTRVAAQKLSFADYNIAMNNAKASGLIGEEFAEMVGKFGKSAMYIAETKEAHKKVQIGDEFRAMEDGFKSAMAQTHDLVGRENLYADYNNNLQSLVQRSSSSIFSTPESQQFISSMQAQSKTIGYAAFTKIESQRFTETKSGIEAKIAIIKQAVTDDPTADLMTHINKANEQYDLLHGIGALSAGQLLSSKFTNAQSLIVARGTRLGKSAAESYLGGDYDSADEKLVEFNKYLTAEGINSSVATNEAFKDAYSTSLAKEWNRLVKEDASREKYGEVKLRDNLRDKAEKFYLGLSRGEISPGEADEYVNGLESLQLYGRASAAKKAYDSKDTPITSVVTAYTDRDSELYADLQSAAYPVFGKGISPSAIRDYLSIDGIQHEPTVVKIIGDMTTVGRANAKDYIDGSFRTDALKVFFLDKVKRHNMPQFMTSIGMNPKEQSDFKYKDLTAAKNIKGIISALSNTGPHLAEVIANMKSMISSDGVTSAKNTPFAAKYRKNSEGKDVEYDKWVDRTGTDEFRAEYKTYITSVFHRAKDQVIKSRNINVEDTKVEIRSQQFSDLYDAFVGAGKGKMGYQTMSREQFMEAAKRLIYGGGD